nr:hypothetical protein [Tanacetum cinerariifolium]
MAKDGESLTSMYKRFSTLINIMDWNGVTPKELSINTKLVNSLQPTQFEPHVKTSKAKNVVRNYDLLALAANSHSNHSYSHASPSYSSSPHPYYVPHPSSVIDYDDDYQGEIQGDAQEDNLSTMLLATKDEASVHLEEEENNFMLVNAYGDDTLEELNASVIMMACIQPTNDKSNAEPTYDAKSISEVNAFQITMINGLLSKSDHEHRHHEKLETIIHTSADDQIESDIIFDDPYMDNNSGQAEHDTNARDQPLPDFKSLINNVQLEAENQRKLNIELKKKKALLQRKLRTCKERVEEFEKKPV